MKSPYKEKIESLEKRKRRYFIAFAIAAGFFGASALFITNYILAMIPLILSSITMIFTFSGIESCYIQIEYIKDEVAGDYIKRNS